MQPSSQPPTLIPPIHYCDGDVVRIAQNSTFWCDRSLLMGTQSTDGHSARRATLLLCPCEPRKELGWNPRRTLFLYPLRGDTATHGLHAVYAPEAFAGANISKFSGLAGVWTEDGCRCSVLHLLEPATE